jgi:hypothetical protein
MMRNELIPGLNVDRLDIAAGMRELAACGYPATETERHMVIQYALQRWARGEEEAAQRGAIDQSFHGIDLTSWLRVLSAAMAAAATNQGGQQNG